LLKIDAYFTSRKHPTILFCLLACLKLSNNSIFLNFMPLKIILFIIKLSLSPKTHF
jgi:hypothetical protein